MSLNPLPILLFVFLAVHVPVPVSHAIPPSLPTTYDGSICSESFKCGGVNISYPFYLSNATTETTDYEYNYSCGYTDLEISCQGEEPTETPVITLRGENYAVQNILYDSHTIVLADSDVLLAGSCPAVHHEVSFDETWLHNSGSNDNLTFFFGCYLRRSVPQQFDTYKIKCVSPPDAGPGNSFVLFADEPDRYLVQELATNCSKVVTVPVIGEVLITAASNQSNFTSGGYGYVLKGGFELEWSRITADQCQQCERSEGHCAYSQSREFLGCLCNGGKVGNPYCKHIASSKPLNLLKDLFPSKNKVCSSVCTASHSTRTCYTTPVCLSIEDSLRFPLKRVSGLGLISY
jgi:hypothetical protein